ncbi:MAG: hypothetical protein D6822_06525, partial [Cyanobacteria bacterium J149]
ILLTLLGVGGVFGGFVAVSEWWDKKQGNQKGKGKDKGKDKNNKDKDDNDNNSGGGGGLPEDYEVGEGISEADEQKWEKGTIDEVNDEFKQKRRQVTQDEINERLRNGGETRDISDYERLRREEDREKRIRRQREGLKDLGLVTDIPYFPNPVNLPLPPILRKDDEEKRDNGGLNPAYFVTLEETLKALDSNIISLSTTLAITNELLKGLNTTKTLQGESAKLPQTSPSQSSVPSVNKVNQSNPSVSQSNNTPVPNNNRQNTLLNQSGKVKPVTKPEKQSNTGTTKPVTTPQTGTAKPKTEPVLKPVTAYERLRQQAVSIVRSNGYRLGTVFELGNTLFAVTDNGVEGVRVGGKYPVGGYEFTLIKQRNGQFNFVQENSSWSVGKQSAQPLNFGGYLQTQNNNNNNVSVSSGQSQNIENGVLTRLVKTLGFRDTKEAQRLLPIIRQNIGKDIATTYNNTINYLNRQYDKARGQNSSDLAKGLSFGAWIMKNIGNLFNNPLPQFNKGGV